MEKIENGYSLVIFREDKRLKKIILSEQDINREILRKHAINIGIEFYALSGPYDAADEILRQWHKYFNKKSFLKRLFEK